MAQLGLEGVVRGKVARTTTPDKAAACPFDLVNRQFHAPAREHALGFGLHLRLDWAGMVYVAPSSSTSSPGGSLDGGVSRNPTAAFVLDALEQALHARQPTDSLIHHSDRGVQYVSIRYTERLAQAGIEPSAAASAIATIMLSPRA